MRQELISLIQSLKTESKEPGDLQDKLERIAATAQEYFSSDLCVIFPINPVTRRFLQEQPTTKGSLASATKNGFMYPRESGLAKRVLAKKTLLVEENAIQKYRNSFIDNEKVRGFAGVALFTTRLQRPLAVIYLDYRKAKKFDQKFQAKLTIFAKLAASELQNTWFVRRYREIVKIGQDINESLEDIDLLFDKVFEHMRGILDVSYYVSLAKYDIRKDNFDLYLFERSQKSIKKNYTFEENSITSWVIKNLETITIDDIRKTEKIPHGMQPAHIQDTASEERSVIFVPIKLRNQPLGVLSVQHPKPKYYDDEDKRILELLANHIALALNNYRLLDNLQQLDRSGQILTEKLDSSDDIISDVVDRIYKTTQADLITLYPYLQSEDRYLAPIHKGDFLEPGSLKKGEATPDAIVHLVNFLDRPVFAKDSTNLYAELGKDYHSGGRFPHRERVQSTVAMPLKAGLEPIGVLFVNYRAKQRFDMAQQWVLSSLGSYAAIAIRNSRQYQKLRERRLNELEDLRQIDQAISKFLNSDKILQTILELTAKYIKADTGLVLLHNKKMNALEPKAIIGNDLPPLSNLILSLDQFRGIAKAAFENKQTIRIDNVREDPTWKNRFVEISKSTISQMDIPLILDDVAIGVMNFESSKEGTFTEDDQKFMEILAGQAVIVVRNAIEYERAQRIARERKALIDIVNTLLSQDDQKKIFSIILGKALEITETSKGTISRCDENRQEIRIVAQSGLKAGWQDVQTFEQGILGRAVREKRIIKIDRVSVDPLKDEFLDAFPGEEESELVVPIRSGDRVIGVINLESENPYHFEEDDVELIQSLASLCAVAINNAESMDQKRLAYIGVITGDLSHKMKSPLSKIQRQIELIEIKQGDELTNNADLAERLRQIANISSDATKIVQKTLDEAKGKFVSIERTSLNLMIKSALDEIEIPHNIKLKNVIGESNILLDVYATRQLANVFHNLVTNGINAIHPNPGSIYIEVERMDKDWVIISVEDSGKGISKDEAQLVFLPISSTGLEGRGFGLSLTKQYIEMIGGKILPPVPGRDGVGTKFLVYLRLYTSSD